ncbi:MAG: hypothetical protein LZF61_01245 [Nitrosomonas sp.]|nr:MAG: hypothetical protein LZF61_01245 [Nitrosomonas sp.]
MVSDQVDWSQVAGCVASQTNCVCYGHSAQRLNIVPETCTAAIEFGWIITVDHVLSIEEWQIDDEWIESETVKKEFQSENTPAKSTTQIQKDDDGKIHLILSRATGLSHYWIFHQSDPDYFPSIPHGHHRQRKHLKLDSYLGWCYYGGQQAGREPRAQIIALWNDCKFREFALKIINWYLCNFPGYHKWRVRNPLRLPKRRH